MLALRKVDCFKCKIFVVVVEKVKKNSAEHVVLEWNALLLVAFFFVLALQKVIVLILFFMLIMFQFFYKIDLKASLRVVEAVFQQYIAFLQGALNYHRSCYLPPCPRQGREEEEDGENKLHILFNIFLVFFRSRIVPF